MSREIIRTNEAPRSLASYSQAVRAAGLVFVSGQGPFDAKTGEVVGATIQEQTALSPQSGGNLAGGGHFSRSGCKRDVYPW
jgi:enamine deaminase RidA (YjgF/YER057c/UK114 family)